MKKFKECIKRMFLKYCDMQYQAHKAMYDAGINWM